MLSPKTVSQLSRLSSYPRLTTTILRTMSSTTTTFTNSLPSWASFDPYDLKKGHAVSNLVDGKWTSANKSMPIIHPLDKDHPPIFTIPDTQSSEIAPFLQSLRKVSKTGLHNPLKNPQRYVQYGEISRKVRQRLLLLLTYIPPHYLCHSILSLTHSSTLSGRKCAFRSPSGRILCPRHYGLRSQKSRAGAR